VLVKTFLSDNSFRHVACVLSFFLGGGGEVKICADSCKNDTPLAEIITSPAGLYLTEGTATINVRSLRIYWIRSREQPSLGDPPS
jgi:hypothetical protein